MVRENDGLVNVWQAHNLAYTPTSVTSLNTFLWGIGGEICRSFYGVPLLTWAGSKRRGGPAPDHSIERPLSRLRVPRRRPPPSTKTSRGFVRQAH